jgi:PAS domain S-box-containing protein
MPFSADLSLLGALTAVAITVVLAFVPFSAERRWLHHAWLTAWAVMSVHFCLQVLQRANVGMPATGWAADGLLVLAVLLFTDWAWRALGAGGRGAGQARRSWTWPGRAFAAGLAGWVWFFPNSHVLAQTIAFGVLPVAGGIAALRLKMGGRLTRWVLGLALIVWGLGFITAPLPWGNVQNGALVDLLTLICKSFCGMAMILFAVDEQRELAEAGRDYFNDLYQNSPMWYHTVDRNGQVTDLNQVAMDVLGMERADIVGRRIRELPQVESPDEAPPVQALMACLEQEGTFPNFELRVHDSDGAVRSFRSYVRAIRDADGRFQGARAMLCDITAERELQNQLLMAQKMQAVGTLTAGVAHDFNNLLSTVLGQVELIEAKHGPQLPADAADRIAAIGAAGRRAAELVAQLLAFSRGREVATEPLSLEAVVASAAEMLRHGLPETVAVEVRLSDRRPSPLTVQGNLTQLQQVLLNLGVNAGQAMPQGGQLVLALDRRRGVVRAGAPPEAASREWAVLTVADNGEGITPDVRERLFEPFFTTKAPGKGSGLGLAVAYGIVEAHGGFITVDSAPGEGARFEIYLPILASGPAVGGAAGSAMGGASGADRQRSGGSDWSSGGAASSGAYSVGGRRASSRGNYRRDVKTSWP